MNRIHKLLFVLLLPALLSAQEMIPAQPRGGERQVKEFIDEEMQYPEDALKLKSEGKVAFDFVIDENGKVENLQIRKHVTPSIDAEAIRIFSLIIWQPAIYRSKAITSKSSLEIPFSVRHYSKACRVRGYKKTVLPSVPIDSSGIVYHIQDLEIMPELYFNSKSKDIQSFMAENLHYPDEALRKNITGTVKVNFVVEPHGRISNIMVTEHVGAGCSEEAIRLVKLLKWKPGMLKGKLVRTNMTIPITFGLSADGGYRVSPAAGGTTFQ